MIRLTTIQKLPWTKLFSVANLFIRYLGLTKYDAFRLAYSCVCGHNILIQGPQRTNFYLLHNKLSNINFRVNLEQVDGLSMQIDRKYYEPVRMGLERKGKPNLWESKLKEVLIFRTI